MKYVRDILLNAGGSLLSIPLALLINVVISRAFGPAGKGELSLLASTREIIMLAVNGGFGFSAVYYLGKQQYALPKVASNLLSLAVTIGVTCSAVILVVYRLLSTYSTLTLPSTAFAVGIVIVVPFYLARVYLSQLFTSLQNFYAYNLLFLADIFLFLVLLSATALFGLPLPYAIGSYVLANCLPALVGWRYLYRKTPSFRFEVDGQLVKTFYRYGLHATTARLLLFLNLRLDQFIILLYLNVTNVGIYAASVAVAELVMRLGSATNSVILSRIVTMSALEAKALTSMTMRFSFTLTLLIAIAVFFVGHYLILLIFGEAFLAGSTALRLLLPGTVFAAFSQILGGSFQGEGRPEVAMKAALIGLVSTLIFDVLLIPTMGINGAAIASTVSYFLSGVFLFVMYVRHTGLAARDLLWLNASDVELALTKLNELRH